MNSELETSGWTKKNATLTDKTAQKEFGLTFQEIIEGIRAGKLQYRETSMYGAGYLRQKQLQNELAKVNKTLRALKLQTLALERRKAELLELLGDHEV